MAIGISVVGDVKEISRDLAAIKKSIPRITGTSLNQLATWARSQVIAETAREMRLPKSVVSQTIRTKKGVSTPTPRFRLVRASTYKPIAELIAVSKGIQVTDIAGAWVGRKPGQGGGVKAKGGRFYKGAFKAKAAGGTVRVWKRTGKERLPIFLPRVGINERLIRAFNTRVAGLSGTAEFRRLFKAAADRELAKLKLS